MDFNASEVVILVVLAVIIFGPEQLPALARKAARVISYVRRIASDAQGQIRQELGPEFADLDVRDLNPRNFISRHVLSPDAEQDLRSTAAQVRDLGSTVSTTAAVATAGTQAAEEERDEPERLRPTPFDPEAT